MSTFEHTTVSTIDSIEVAWLVTKRAAAIRARDAEYLASRYAASALTFGVAPPLGARAGEAQQVEWLRRWFGRFRGPIGYAVRGLTVSVAGDLAFCHSHDELLVHARGRWRRAEQFETTLGLSRVHGVWLVTSESIKVEGRAGR